MKEQDPRPCPAVEVRAATIQEEPHSPAKRKAVSLSTQPKLSGFVVETTANQKTAIDKEITKLFYGCNLPFNIADHPQWIKVVSILRPGYIPPNRKTVAGSLLDEIHSELKLDMKKAIGGQTATLIEDGWSNIHNEPVIAACLQAGQDVFFLDSYDTGPMTKTAENCKDLRLDFIKTAKLEYDCEVKSIVTDNARSMEKM